MHTTTLIEKKRTISISNFDENIVLNVGNENMLKF